MIDYSFIIPHKNTPELLQKCIDSIPHRDDVQIIVVDDNSDSEKVDFEHFPRLNDSFVEVYLTKEGRGAGYARNFGLSHAVGKWVVFADADDYFFPCIVDAMTTYTNSEAEIVFFKSRGIRLSDGKASSRGMLYNERVEFALLGDFSPVLQMSSPCCKFIKRNIIVNNNLSFSESRWANDVVFMAKLAICTSKYEASALPVYCITESPTSLVYARSLDSQVVRFQQELEGVKIYRKRFQASELSYWFFFTWKSVYIINKKKALSLLPSAIQFCGIPFLKELWNDKFSRERVRRRLALRWGRLRAKYARKKMAVVLYPSFWHLAFRGAAKSLNHDNYITARPNPSAGIGHQISNWHSGYYYSKLFGLSFACSNFSKPDWQNFLGYNDGEVSIDYLLQQGYWKIRLPLFGEYNPKEVERTRRIISSFNNAKTVFILEQDQPYHNQYEVAPFVRNKFFSAQSRKYDRLPFDDSMFNVAVHIRRGDITIGQKNGDPNLTMRWLDNSYYVKVLSTVLPLLKTSKEIAIYIFSQGDNADFNDFNQFDNIHFFLDSNPQDAFLAFVHADLLLTSKSSFSYKPALINEKGIKVCPRNFWHGYPDSGDWILAEDDGTFSQNEIAKLFK